MKYNLDRSLPGKKKKGNDTFRKHFVHFSQNIVTTGNYIYYSHVRD